MADKNHDGKDDKTGKFVAKPKAVVATPAPVVAAKPVVIAPLTEDEQRTALDHKRRALEGSAGPVGQSGVTSASDLKTLEDIDREGVLLNQKRQDAAAKAK